MADEQQDSVRYIADDGSIYQRVDPGSFEIWGGMTAPLGRVKGVALKSQNGYPANDRSCVETKTVPGTSVRLPVRRGPAGDLLIWAAERWHREVEALVPGTCWGYAERLIRGSATDLSNHASGTAIDLNAPQHPLGTNPAANFTGPQIASIKRIVDDTAWCLRWGGTYSGRKDGMHIEVVANEESCASALARLTGGTKRELTSNESDMLRKVYDVLCVPRKPWGGGISDISADTPELTARAAEYTAMGYWLRDNVTANQTSKGIATLLVEMRAMRAELTLLRAQMTTELPKPLRVQDPPRNLPSQRWDDTRETQE